MAERENEGNMETQNKKLKDDHLIIRIEKDLKQEFTKINKKKKVKYSKVIRNWITEYVAQHKSN